MNSPREQGPSPVTFKGASRKRVETEDTRMPTCGTSSGDAGKQNLNLDDIELTGDEIVLILDTTEEPRMTSWKKEPNLNLTDLSQTRKEMRAAHHPRSSIRKKKSHNSINSTQESTEE